MPAKPVTPPLARLLADIPSLVPLERIDRVWVFPSRMTGEVESGLVVLALWPEEAAAPEEDQREVVTIQYATRPGKEGEAPAREVAGRGWAPADRVPRLIAGVLRRLGGEEDEPRSESIGGDAAAWEGFVAGMGDATVDRSNGE
jgi:hypothetical protein